MTYLMTETAPYAYSETDELKKNRSKETLRAPRLV